MIRHLYWWFLYFYEEKEVEEEEEEFMVSHLGLAQGAYKKQWGLKGTQGEGEPTKQSTCAFMQLHYQSHLWSAVISWSFNRPLCLKPFHKRDIRLILQLSRYKLYQVTLRTRINNNNDSNISIICIRKN